MAGLNIIWNTPKQVSGQCKNWVPGRRPKELTPRTGGRMRKKNLFKVQSRKFAVVLDGGAVIRFSGVEFGFETA
jgi:hypothetical protein